MSANPRIDLSTQLGAPCPAQDVFQLGAALRQWLIQHYADPNNITQPQLQTQFITNGGWKNDDTTSILIEEIGRWRPTLTEKRPGLIIKRGQLDLLHQGVGGSRLQGSSREIYSIQWVCSYTVLCIGGESAETELLAIETYRELNKFANVVRRKLDILRIQCVGAGELGKLEEAREHFVVPVTLALANQENWEITPLDTARLDAILLNLI